MSNPSPIIVAHRGLHTEYPENSLPAFEAAWNLPLQWAECDVYVLGDGVVVLHDDTLDRTTEFTGSVYDRAACQVQGCRLRDPLGQLTSHILPSLRQVIAAMPANGQLMIEIKGSLMSSDFMPELMREVKGRTVMIQSFDPRHLFLASRYDRFLPLAYLVDTDASLADAILTRYPAVHATHGLLNAAAVKKLHRAGKSIGAWTVNTPEDMRRMIDLGVDMLITDEPKLATEICGKTKS